MRGTDALVVCGVFFFGIREVGLMSGWLGE